MLLLTSECTSVGRRITLSRREKHPLRRLTPNVVLSFSHSHAVISSEKPKPFARCHPAAPRGLKCLSTLWIFRLLRRLSKIVVLVVWSPPGWASPWWSWPVWLACATCWPRMSDWDGTCESRLEEERKILGPVAVFSSAPCRKWPQLGQFTGAAWSHLVATPWQPAAFRNTLGLFFMKLLQRPADVASTQQ